MKARGITHRLLFRTGMLLAAAALAGCNSGMSDLTQFVKKVEARPGPRLKPIPRVKPYEGYAYSDKALRSPFKPQTPTAASGNVEPQAHRNKEYLEQFPLDSLTMVGTIRMNGARWALIKDSENLVNRVKRGNYMGQNDGRIIKITQTGLVLREIVPNGLGGYVKRKTDVPLDVDSSKAGKP